MADGRAARASLRGGGDMGARIRAFDWSSHPLGPPDHWPDELHTALAICLNSSFPTAIYWGQDLLLLYNDAWSPVPGERHPWALGRSAGEVWTDIWDVVGPQFERVLRQGEGVSTYDEMLPMVRGGQVRETYWNYSFTPILDDSGRVLGVFNQGHETTAKVMAERAHVAETERLRETFAQAPGAIAVLRGPKHIFEIANAAYMALVGDRPDIVGLPVAEALPEVVPQGFIALLDRVYQTGEPYIGLGAPVELFRHGERETRIVDFIYQPTRDAGGAVDGIFVQATDVTERALAERALRDYADERAFLDALSDRLREAASPEDATAVACAALGKRLGAGRCGYAHVDDDARRLSVASDWTSDMPSMAGSVRMDDFPHRIVSAFRAGETIVVNDTHTDDRTSASVAAYGAVGHLRASIAAPLIKDGRFTAALYVHQATPRNWTREERALVEDVAERTWAAVERARAEGLLRQEKQRLETLNGVFADVAVELQADRIVQMIVDRSVALTGAKFGAFFYNLTDEQGDRYTLYALSGAAHEAFAAFTMPRATEVFHPTFSGSGVVRSNNILDDARYGRNPPHNGMPEGHLPVKSYLAAPVVSRSGEVLGGLFFGHPRSGVFKPEHESLIMGVAGQAAIAIDNARLFEQLEKLNATLEQRVANEVAERTRAEEKLRQAQKMEAIGQLTGGIAHDFNNMLAVVIGGLNLSRRRLERGDAEIAHFIEAAMDGAQRAASLTQRLLAFSRQQPLAPEPLNANTLVKSMTELLSRTLGDHIQVETVLSAGLWRTFADPVQVESTILNLAVNARDAMPAGGKLTLETGNAAIDATSAREFDVPEGQYVLIAVSDTGVGMSSDVIAHAFDPFYTTKAVGKGTGLGLSQVFGFVRQSGGHVKLYSEEGHGTTVKVYLPRHYGEGGVDAAPAAPVRAHDATPSELVLVVEDEERVRAYSTEALKELGYMVVAAANGAQALKVMEETPDVALLFTDVVMPEMSGRQLAEIALQRRPDLKVLFTTAYTRNAAVHNSVLDPGTNFLQKPFTIDQLALKVRSVLDG
ncbi:MAG: GAF domain-containing protein [Alphaproteobacteria bacterium]|nr:GAF domain-containing protein [Alphaproteobacteria bacterium]